MKQAWSAKPICLLHHFTHPLRLKLATQGTLLDQMPLHLTQECFVDADILRGGHLSYTNDDRVRRKSCEVMIIVH